MYDAPAPVKMQAFLAKAVGVDMMWKTFAWGIRLAATQIRTNDNVFQFQMMEHVNHIIDFRILANHWKYIATFKSFVTAVTCRNCKDCRSSVVWILTVLSFWFRTLEQLSGDVGFFGRYAFGWERKRTSWHYRFNKSLSLTMCFLIECFKIMKLSKEISTVTAVTPFAMSPAMTPSVPRVGFPSQNADDLLSQRRRAILMALRNFGDMIIYYQWIPQWKPSPVLQGICGVYSGAFGCYLVWEWISDELRKENEKIQSDDDITKILRKPLPLH